jgi:hypothetical protein
VDSNGTVTPNNLNDRIQASIDKYLSQRLSNDMARNVQGATAFLPPSYVQYGPPSQTPTLKDNVIESFTTKIDQLQTVINEQRVTLDIKEKEIKNLKVINSRLQHVLQVQGT